MRVHRVGFALGFAFLSATVLAGPCGPCTADVDDGTGTGTPDGGVTIEDLLFYLQIYSDGDNRACSPCNCEPTPPPDEPGCCQSPELLLLYLVLYGQGC